MQSGDPVQDFIAYVLGLLTGWLTVWIKKRMSKKSAFDRKEE